MELQQLGYTVAIAEEQSFTCTAERCFVVQSTLSRQIKSLENELGVRLLARANRKVEMTPAGEAFVKQARLCLRTAEHAKVAAAATRGDIRGTLTIGVIPTVTVVDVAAVLGAFRRDYPEMGVYMRTGDSDEFLRHIAAGELDMAFSGLTGGVTPRGVQMRELSWERLAAALAKGHRLTERRRPRLEDLADETFVDFPEGSSGREQSDPAFGRAGLRREVSFEVNTTDLLAGLVRQGLRAALVTPSVTRETPGCVCVPANDGPVRVEYLAWDSFSPSPMAQIFVDSVLMPTGQRPLSLTATTTWMQGEKHGTVRCHQEEHSEQLLLRRRWIPL